MFDDFNKFRGNLSRLKDLASIGLANILATAISAVFWLYIASLVGEEGYGKLSFLIATASIVATISSLGSYDTLTVYRSKEVKIQATIFSIVIIFSLISSLVAFFIIQSIEVSIYVLGYVVFSLSIYEMLGRKQYTEYSKFFVTQRILAVVLGIGLYFLIGLSGVILGYALSFFPFSYKIYQGFRESKIDFSIFKPRMNFMMTNYARSLLQTFSISLDKLIIFPMFGAALLGNYQLGWQVFNALSLLPGIVFQYMLPQDASGIVRPKLKKFTVIVSAGISGLAVILTPLLLPIFFPQFVKSIEIVQIMSLNIIPTSISLMYISKFLGEEKIKIILIEHVLSLSVLIGGIFLLGGIYGINGAAVAFLISGIVGTVFFVIVNKMIK